MKKFLTVLLALSVVFTYTFGTAFAAPTYSAPELSDRYTPAQAELKINETAAEATATVDLALKVALSKYAQASFDVEYDTRYITKQAVTNVLTEKAAEKKKLIENARISGINSMNAEVQTLTSKGAFIACTALKADYQGSTGSGDAVDYGYASFKTELETITAINLTNYTGYISGTESGRTKDLDAEFAKEAFKLCKEQTLKDMAVIDLSSYSKTIEAGKSQSNYDLAAGIIAQNMTFVNNVVLDSGDDTSAKVGVKTKKIVDTYVKGVNEETSKGELVTVAYDKTGTTTGLPGLLNIKKVKEETTDAMKLEILKKAALAQIKTIVAADLATAVATDQADLIKEQLADKPNQATIDAKKKAIAAAEKKFAAVETVLTYKLGLVEAYGTIGDVTSGIASLAGKPWGNAAGLYAQIVAGESTASKSVLDLAFAMTEKVEQLKIEAKLAEGTIAITGITVVEVQAALDTAIDSVYAAKTPADVSKIKLEVTSAEKYLKAVKAGLIGATATNVEVKKVSYPNVKKWVDAGTLSPYYDAAKYAEIRLIAIEAKTAIEVAKTVVEAEDAFLAAYKKFDAVPTAAERLALFAPNGALYADYNKAAAEIRAYATYKIAGMAKVDAEVYNAATLGNKLADTLKADVYTVADLTAKLAAARTTVDTLKTKADVQAMRKDLDAKVLAMGNKVTLADKAKVAELRDAVTAYNDYLDDTTCTADVKITAAATLMDANYNAIKAIEEKAIVDAYVALGTTIESTEAAAVAAIVKAYEEFVLYYSDPEATTFVTPAGVDIIGLQTKLATAQANDFAKVINALPAVVASKADAVAVQKAFTDYNALSAEAKDLLDKDGTVYTKLYVLNVYAQKFMDEYTSNGVQNTTLKATSKATKNAIKISWKKSAGFKVDGYQVYKSTKKYSGFKKAFTTKATSYKNTKGLKAGKTYFYKVRGFRTIDGVKYYTQWSTKVSRVAK